MAEIEEPIIEKEEPITEVKEEKTDNLKDAFKEFKESISEHNVEENTSEEEEEEDNDFIPDEDQLDEIEEFKVQMFLGFCFTLLDGFHVWVYKYISPHEINADQLSLTETEQNSLMNYFKTKRVLQIINKIPPELIGIIHMEYMYYRKYRQIVREKEAEEQKKKSALLERFRKFKEKQKNRTKTEPKERKENKPPVKKAAKKKEKVKVEKEKK